MSRYAVVEKAAEKGAAAVLMYTEATAQFNGGGVERGTVMGGLGDPLTPGWAGVEGGERLGLEDSDVLRRFPKIPSMPLSVDTAEIILRSLEGTRVPYEWRGTLKSEVGSVGPGPTLLNFTYQVILISWTTSLYISLCAFGSGIVVVCTAIVCVLLNSNFIMLIVNSELVRWSRPEIPHLLPPKMSGLLSVWFCAIDFFGSVHTKVCPDYNWGPARVWWDWSPRLTEVHCYL